MAGRKKTLGEHVPTESKQWAKESYDALMEKAVQVAATCNRTLSVVNTQVTDKTMRSTRIAYVEAKGTALTPEINWLEENIVFTRPEGKSESDREVFHLRVPREKGKDTYSNTELLKGQPVWSHKHIKHAEDQLSKIRSAIKRIKKHLAERTALDKEIISILEK